MVNGAGFEPARLGGWIRTSAPRGPDLQSGGFDLSPTRSKTNLVATVGFEPTQ